MNLALEISENYFSIDGIIYEVILIKGSFNDDKWSNESGSFTISVSDGTNMVKSFLSQLSGNLKEIIGIFTTDAFSSISPSSVEIIFERDRKPIYVFQGVDLTTGIIPLPHTATTVPQADNAWLNSLS